jgi:hypothetical protein
VKIYLYKSHLSVDLEVDLVVLVERELGVAQALAARGQQQEVVKQEALSKKIFKKLCHIHTSLFCSCLFILSAKDNEHI